MSAGILVWSERPALERELLGQARRLADGADHEVCVCAHGEIDSTELDSYAASGADVVYLPGSAVKGPAAWVDALSAVIARLQPGLVLVGATKTGMEVAPRVAERFQAAFGAWAVDIEFDPAGARTIASCMLYAGSGLATYSFSGPVTVLTTAQGVFEADNLAGRTARVEPVAVSLETPHVQVKGERAKPTGGSGVEQAKAVVDIGRGVKRIEDLEMVRLLATLLDAQLGCSRPVSSDRDWLPDWLGLSGAKVKPELCLTLGISGAVQHVVGIRNSRVIAAINNDENAAIFTQADFGVVADLDEFVPVLIERLQQRGARPAWLQSRGPD